MPFRTDKAVSFSVEHEGVTSELALSLMLAVQDWNVGFDMLGEKPPQVSLPAVSRADGQTMLYDTQRTWLWNAPSPPPPKAVETATMITRF